MTASPEFQSDMFNWVESIIQCQLPSTLVELKEEGKQLKPPLRHPKGDPHL